MAEYIERKKLKEAFDNADPDVCERYPDGDGDWGFGRENVRDVIRGVPTVDAVPVVRCKDCKKLGTGECPMEQDYPWISTDSDDFCSYGERRDYD